MTALRAAMAALLLSASSAAALMPAMGVSAASAAEAGTALPHYSPRDLFDLEYADDPQISPDGRHIVYVRVSNDIMTDRARRNLWIIDTQTGEQRPILSGTDSYSSPRWSPDGKRLAYISSTGGSAQIYVRWMDTGQTARVTNLPEGPSNLAWSPDGKWLAFTMFVPEDKKPLAAMPPKPEGAKWGDAPRVIDDVIYRVDGAGYLESGFSQVFLAPSEGGSPRQLTTGHFDHDGTPTWAPDGKSLLISANRRDDAVYNLNNSEVYEITLATGGIRQLTDRNGPDGRPIVSPDGKHIAIIGYDDQKLGYQIARLEVMDRDGKNRRVISANLDRDVDNPVWREDGKGFYFQYDDKGVTRLAEISLDGRVRDLAANLGGTDLGRPYGSGSFSVSKTGKIAFLTTNPKRPADVALYSGGKVRQLTGLNEDVLAYRDLADAEEMWVKSSADGRDIQAWLMKPPGFDPNKKYPLILEIHGGPFANYGPRFGAEMQAYAAAGYVVVYANPRGSTSYGEAFGNLIHHNYPSQDYDDLMSVVDAVIAKGFVDDKNLFVTGGSGGGVLTAWIVGKTDRFRAAVVSKPVINWTSFALTADMAPFFTQYWFPAMPWEAHEQYWKRSPLSLVGNVKTPTMLLTGESDYRTPMSETEQYYQALKLRRVDTAMVRIPDASHGMSSRPTQLIAKNLNILAWFEKYRTQIPASEGAANVAAQ
ncbi:alpha/beta hydrolase family protein [Pedomonas mirosovicensis]|uniref:alpha/beta hydrolase family protein n=1 Tax=Pedomonas mirosovicensis TaxID=2908641 RepID=UPI002167BB2A|nr:S9 family peptidase [Pedomonas mirosovicensis]MCH8684369.1 S9 family peptidase [Pedomonas mirosovicensis]